MYEYKSQDVFNLASFIGAEAKQKGNELFFKYCPNCKGGGHDKETFSINLDNGAFKCFRSSCDYHGHFVELARDVGFKLEDEAQKQYRTLPQKKVESKPKAIEYLERVDDEEIEIYLVNPKAPCFIKNPEESYIYLILPVNFTTVS